MVVIECTTKELSGEDLVSVYKAFCKAHGIECSQDDEIFFKESCLTELSNSGNIDYRPYMGAKFFVVSDGKQIEFKGYSKPNDPEQGKKDSAFQKEVKTYFTNYRS